MPKYLVSIEEVIRYTIEVSAKSKPKAEEKAIELLIVHGADATDGNWSVEEREVYCTMEKKP